MAAALAPLSLTELGFATGRTSQADVTTERRSRYLLTNRRVAVGPDLALVFENRETLWFRLQELGRVARLTSAAHVRHELDWYTRLLPAAGTLTAALWVGATGRRATRAAAQSRDGLAHGRVTFVDATGATVAGHVRGDRVHDRLIGVVGWVEFAFTPAEVAAFATPGRGWHLAVDAGGVRVESDTLSDAVWHSLNADLAG